MAKDYLKESNCSGGKLINPASVREDVSTVSKTIHTMPTPNRMISHVSPVTLLPTSSTPTSDTHVVEETPPEKMAACVTPTPISSKAVYNVTPHSSMMSMASVHRVTPPMCDCGRRTKRKLVTKTGPSEGKPFYVCPSSSGSNRGRGCGFFKWEIDQLQNASPTGVSVSLTSRYSNH